MNSSHCTYRHVRARSQHLHKGCSSPARDLMCSPTGVADTILRSCGRHLRGGPKPDSVDGIWEGLEPQEMQQLIEDTIWYPRRTTHTTLSLRVMTPDCAITQVQRVLQDKRCLERLVPASSPGLRTILGQFSRRGSCPPSTTFVLPFWFYLFIYLFIDVIYSIVICF